MLKRKLRVRAREIARANYVRQKGTKSVAVINAVASSRNQIKNELGSGIITSILVSLMIKLATKYIMQWAEDNLFSHHVPEQFEEIR